MDDRATDWKRTIKRLMRCGDKENCRVKPPWKISEAGGSDLGFSQLNFFPPEEGMRLPGKVNKGV